MVNTQTNTLAQPILEGLSTAILLLDKKLRVHYLNPAAETLFAISQKKASALSIRQLLPATEAFIQSLELAMQDGHPFTERELTLQLSDKRTVIVDSIVNPLMEPGSEVTLLIELIQIDRHLRITREEHLIQQHEASRELIRGLAHEIKNPLGGLRGAAQLLERELPSEGLREYTQVIIDEADRLQDLVNRLLGPHKLPKKQAINIHQVLERVRHLVTAESPDTLHIRTDYDPSIPELFADMDQLIQATLNIVKNATKAMENCGTITLRTRTRRQFTIGHERHKLVASIEIADNGPGIPEEIIDRIFYPMVTGHAQGTGLGLSIAQSMIHRHSGLIECSSKPGKTVFTLLLPIQLDQGQKQ